MSTGPVARNLFYFFGFSRFNFIWQISNSVNFTVIHVSQLWFSNFMFQINNFFNFRFQ
jgi:hypothetical protein